MAKFKVGDLAVFSADRPLAHGWFRGDRVLIREIQESEYKVLHLQERSSFIYTISFRLEPFLRLCPFSTGLVWKALKGE